MLCRLCKLLFSFIFMNKSNKIQVIRTLKWIKRKKKRLRRQAKGEYLYFLVFIQSLSLQTKWKKEERKTPKCQRFKRFYDNKHKGILHGTLPINNFDQYLRIEAAVANRIQYPMSMYRANKDDDQNISNHCDDITSYSLTIFLQITDQNPIERKKK